MKAACNNVDVRARWPPIAAWQGYSRPCFEERWKDKQGLALDAAAALPLLQFCSALRKCCPAALHDVLAVCCDSTSSSDPDVSLHFEMLTAASQVNCSVSVPLGVYTASMQEGYMYW